MERKHSVQVGDIFTGKATGECGSAVGFYQVLRLRGKTLADISRIGCDFCIDKTCDSARSECRVIPRMDEFYDVQKILSTRVYFSEYGNKYCLHTIETKEERHFRKYFFPYNPNDVYRFSGYDGQFIIDQLGLKPKAEE